MTSRIVTVASWNDTHNAPMTFLADSGFIVIVGTQAVWRATRELAEKFAKAVEFLTDDQIAQSL